MTGRKFFGKTHESDSQKRTSGHQSSTMSLRQQSGHIDSMFLTQRLREATRHFCTILGFQETKVQRPCAWMFWNKQRQASSVLLTRVANGTES